MAVKVCSNCGESNRENALVCVGCSHSLQEAALQGTKDSEKEFTGLLGNYERTGRITCSYCKETIEPGALTCKYCNTPVTRSKASKPYYSSSASSPDGCAVFLLFFATLLIPIVGLIVGGFYALNGNTDKQDIGIGLLAFGLVILIIEIIVGVALM
jgi:hypothetical protein